MEFCSGKPDNPAASVMDYCTGVLKFNIGYSHSGCIKLLARLGFKYRKPKTLPRVSDVEKQAAFIAFYENLLNNLPAGSVTRATWAAIWSPVASLPAASIARSAIIVAS